jgi:transcriptional regulator of arginine metabolism
MKNKDARLLKIRKLIGNKKISSQDELLKQLEKNGFNMTQATLSRDLKFLRVAKMPDGEKGYTYSIPEADTPLSPKSLESFPMNGFLSLEFAQGLGLMKTLPGFASSIASAVDMMKISDIAGTIAGDDTILLVPRDGAKKDEVVRQLADFIPGMKQKLIQK